MHQKRVGDAFERGDVATAQMHWTILERAIPRLSRNASQIELFARTLSLRYLDEADIVSSDRDRAQLIDRAEILIAMDDRNRHTLEILIKAHLFELRAANSRLREHDSGRQRPIRRLIESDGQLPSQRRLRTTMRRSARRLRRHVRTASLLHPTDNALIAQGLTELAYYYAFTGATSIALRMARRAKQLDGRGEITNLVRSLRRRQRRQ